MKAPLQLIHIGYPKTATKWFQNNLFPNVKNYTYIHHNRVKRTIIEPNILKLEVLDPSSDIITHKDIIISEENLIGSIQDGGMQRLQTKEMALRLKHLFPNASIVIFIRNQKSLIASAYLQYIKMGGNYSVNRYLYHSEFNFTSNRKLFSFDLFKFDETIELYKELFGFDNVFVYLYEEFASGPKAFTEKFASQHGLDVDTSNLNFQAVNQRYRTGMIPLSKFLNSFTRQPILFKYYLIDIPKWHFISRELKKHLSELKILGKIPSDSKVLGEDNIKYIHDYFVKSNINLIGLFKRETLEEYGYLKLENLQ